MTPWFIALVLARGLDATTTCIGFAHAAAIGRGAVEVGLLMPSTCQKTVLVQAGASVVGVLGAQWLVRKGHPKAAKWITGVQVSANSVAAV